VRTIRLPQDGQWTFGRIYTQAIVGAKLNEGISLSVGIRSAGNGAWEVLLIATDDECEDILEIPFRECLDNPTDIEVVINAALIMLSDPGCFMEVVISQIVAESIDSILVHTINSEVEIDLQVFGDTLTIRIEPSVAVKFLQIFGH